MVKLNVPGNQIFAPQGLFSKFQIVSSFFVIGMIGCLMAYAVGRGMSELFSTSTAVDRLYRVPAPNKLISQSGVLVAFLITVVLAPLVEEALFRLWQKYSVRNVIFSFVLWQFSYSYNTHAQNRTRCLMFYRSLKIVLKI